MADERWRALERRWQQTGAVEDEAALLVERVRAGELVEARARLVAWLGHEAAASMGPGFDARQGQDAFWRGVVAFGPEVAVRAALALARRRRRQIDDALRTIASEARRRPGEEFMAWGRAASQCVDSAASWVLAPTEAARVVLERDVLRTTRVDAPPGKAVSGLAASVRVLAELARGGEGRPWATVAAEELDLVRAVMRAEVVPWALGQRDPLREEVDQRLAAVSNIKIASPCLVTWDDMRVIEGDARVRLCEGCDQQVFDLNRLALEEAEALVRAREQGKRLCVRLYRRTDGSVLLRDCPVGLDERVDPEVGRQILIG